MQNRKEKRREVEGEKEKENTEKVIQDLQERLRILMYQYLKHHTQRKGEQKKYLKRSLLRTFKN